MKYKNLNFVTVNDTQSCVSTVIQWSLTEEIHQSDTCNDDGWKNRFFNTEIFMRMYKIYKESKAVTMFWTNVAIEDRNAYTIVIHHKVPH